MELTEKRFRLYQALDFQHLEALVDCYAEMCQSPVFLTDRMWNFLLPEQSDKFAAMLPELKRLHLEKISPEHPIAQVDTDLGCWLIGGLYRRDTIAIIASLPAQPKLWGSEDEQLMETFLHALDLWFSAKSPRTMMYHRTSSGRINLLLDLLQGKIISEKTLQERLCQTIVSVPAECAILIVDFDEVELQDTKAYFAAEYLTQMFTCPMFCYWDNHLVFLVDTTEVAPWRKEMAEQLEGYLQTYRLRGSCSLSFSNLLQTENAYFDAKKTSELAKRLRPITALSFASNYMTYIMLDLASPKLNIMKNINPLLIELRSYDDQHHTELFNTLYIYLQYIKDPTTAAKLLNIHKNTYFYRLNMIKKFMKNVTLEKGETIMQLMISYHILEFLGEITLPDV